MAFSGARAKVTVTAAGISAAAVALATIGLVSAPAWADTTATPASTHVLAAASYATSTFHDEWDFSDTADLLLDDTGPAMNIASPSWSGGVLTYTAKPGSYVSPLWGGYPGSLFQNRDGELPANRIAASSYDHISIHAFSSAAVSSAVQWFDSPTLNSSTEGGQPFNLEPGWHEYDIPLGTNKFPGLKVNWAGTIEGIRLATSPSANTTIKLDFIRLYKAGADAASQASWTVSGDPAQPYWSSNGATSCPAESQTCGPVQDASGAAVAAAAGGLTVDASAYPAGTTLFLATPGGASGIPGSAITVQPRPQPIVDTPAAAGCGDYATSVLGHPWLSSLSTVTVHNAKNVKLSGGKLTATNTSNDPNVYFKLAAAGVDATVWRYLSVTETYTGAFNLKASSGGGTVGRVLWATPGRSLSQSQDLLTYTDRPTIDVDLGTPAATLTESTAAVRYGWSGTTSTLRWDPNEDPGARTWSISKVTLGRECETTAGSGYAITWHDPGWVAGTTAVVEAVASNGSVHQLASVAEKSGENTLKATAGELPLGDYSIRVVSTSPTPGVSATGTSATPLRFIAPASRVGGSDRYGTGVAASKAEYPKGASTVLIASGANYPDALAAAPAAVAAGGPVLLTDPSRLLPSVATELKRLKPRSVYVVGGTSAIKAAVLTQIRSATGVTPVRVAGADRFATSAAIAARFFKAKTAKAFVATGAGFPDALSAAAAGARLGAPVLLVNGTASAPTSAVAAQLRRLRPSALYVVGGTTVMSSAMVGSLARIAHTTRLAGADRFQTSVEVGKEFAAATPHTAILASGLDFPDALVGSALAGKRGAPLYLAEHACITSGVNAELTSIGLTSVTLMGETAALTAGVADETRC